MEVSDTPIYDELVTELPREGYVTWQTDTGSGVRHLVPVAFTTTSGPARAADGTISQCFIGGTWRIPAKGDEECRTCRASAEKRGGIQSLATMKRSD